jgi:hypothetical protein
VDQPPITLNLSAAKKSIKAQSLPIHLSVERRQTHGHVSICAQRNFARRFEPEDSFGVNEKAENRVTREIISCLIEQLVAAVLMAAAKER